MEDELPRQRVLMLLRKARFGARRSGSREDPFVGQDNDDLFVVVVVVATVWCWDVLRAALWYDRGTLVHSLPISLLGGDGYIRTTSRCGDETKVLGTPLVIIPRHRSFRMARKGVVNRNGAVGGGLGRGLKGHKEWQTSTAPLCRAKWAVSLGAWDWMRRAVETGRLGAVARKWGFAGEVRGRVGP